MEINYDLLPKQKTQKHNLGVEIDLYPYATELYEELDKMGIIERIKEIPQLGVIKVKKKLAKTRFDYVMLQLYLHKLIKNRLQGDLRYTYNNYINSKEFREDYVYPDKKNKPSMGDIFQLLTIIYNVGHFYNTFTASRAITMIAQEDSDFRNLVVNACTEERYQNVAKTILESKNYQRLHLLNSILVLEHCNKSKQSVSVALEILYAYINEQLLSEESKLRYAFAIFRNVRTVSYMACVVCTRGKNTRIKELQSLLKSSIGNEDENHEVKFLLSQIINDSINDTTITIPASIIVYQKDAVGRKLSEFDGLIIHPMRKSNQVIFLEAKNRDKKPSFGKKCLIEKFDKFSFKYVPDSIKVVDHDAFWKYSIK